MLNETWRLWQALLKANIPIESQHPLIHRLPASEKNILRVRLNNDGGVADVEEIADSERSEIKRIFRGNDGSFPVIKLNQPLINISAESSMCEALAKARQSSKKIELIKTLFTQYPIRTWEDAGWSWTESLRKARILEKMFLNDEKANILSNLAIRFQRTLDNKTEFIMNIGKIVLDNIRTGRLSHSKTIQELLTGKGKDSLGKDKKISVLLVLDCDDSITVYTKSLWQRVAEVLPTDLSVDKRTLIHCATRSAFGEDDILMKEPFPKINLPVLNAPFPLLSMASSADKAKCNKRYGLTEYITCPVTIKQARKMQSALTWIVTRQEGTTWRGIASGKYEMDIKTKRKREVKDLLIVFVEERPDLDAKSASYFSAGPKAIQSKFEVDTQAICQAYDGILQEYPKSRLNLFLIRKASDGQAMITLSESPSIRDVIQAAAKWQESVRANLPEVRLYLPKMTTKNGNIIPELKDAQPLVPYPDQVVRLLSHHWIRDGSSPKGTDGKPQDPNHESVGPGLGEVLILMFRSKGRWESVARRMLDLLVDGVGPLLIGLFGSEHAYGPRHAQGQHEPASDYPRWSREITLRAIATLGILLDALTFRKEVYMKGAPFQIGQVLSLADTLHKDYCIVVRNGQLPNSLIGTALMRRALSNPAGAVADLSERIIEYIRWAKIAQISHDTSENEQIAINEAHKKLRQYQPLAENLSTVELPTTCDDIMKAQLLLGFLASQPNE
jgi:hypothetical protein